MGSFSEILLPVVVTPGVVICQKVIPGTRYFNFLRSRQKYFNLFKFLNSFTIRILLIGNFYYYLLLVIFNSRIKLKSFFGPTFESELKSVHQITSRLNRATENRPWGRWSPQCCPSLSFSAMPLPGAAILALKWH